MKFGKTTVSKIIDRCDHTFDQMIEVDVLTPEVKEKVMNVVKQGIELKDTHDIGLVITALISQMDLLTLRDLLEGFKSIDEKVTMAMTMEYLSDPETTF